MAHLIETTLAKRLTEPEGGFEPLFRWYFVGLTSVWTFCQCVGVIHSGCILIYPPLSDLWFPLHINGIDAIFFFDGIHPDHRVNLIYESNLKIGNKIGNHFFSCNTFYTRYQLYEQKQGWLFFLIVLNQESFFKLLTRLNQNIRKVHRGSK